MTNRNETCVKLKEKEDLYKALKVEGDGKVCPLLSRSILFGVAFHNSGNLYNMLCTIIYNTQFNINRIDKC